MPLLSAEPIMSSASLSHSSYSSSISFRCSPDLQSLLAVQDKNALSRGERHALDALRVDIDYDSSQYPLAVFTARVEADSATQLLRPSAFMDVTVQRKPGLVPIYGLADGPAA